MNDDLLAAARRAQERLIEAEHDAEVARAEFHRAVRRLHLHGGSLREVAPALGLSHQRVHQIVESAGGSRRWSPRRAVQRVAGCTFCGRPEVEAGPLIAGPGVYVCTGCTALASDALAADGPGAAGPLRAVPAQDVRERCSFCGKYRPECAGLAATPAGAGAAWRGAICGECLMLCAEIIAERDS
ncbi:MAG: ClpX C4-type zinc finger protein [Streptosporangiaceae bacterium]